jgi:hypothetical protein
MARGSGDCAGDCASPARSPSPGLPPPFLLGSVPPALLLLPFGSLSPWTPLDKAAPSAAMHSPAGACEAGAPGAPAAPPAMAILTELSGLDVDELPERESLPVSGSAGVLYPSPGAAFLDSILSMFHTMVAKPICVSSSEVFTFWIAAANRSPRINLFCVVNALNFNLTSFPDRFAISCHGGGVFSSSASSEAVRDRILAHRSVRLGSSVYSLHRLHAGAAAAVVALPPWPPMPACSPAVDLGFLRHVNRVDHVGPAAGLALTGHGLLSSRCMDACALSSSQCSIGIPSPTFSVPVPLLLCGVPILPSSPKIHSKSPVQSPDPAAALPNVEKPELSQHCLVPSASSFSTPPPPSANPVLLCRRCAACRAWRHCCCCAPLRSGPFAARSEHVDARSPQVL